MSEQSPGAGIEDARRLLTALNGGTLAVGAATLYGSLPAGAELPAQLTIAGKAAASQAAGNEDTYAFGSRI